jgi:hypothetical protein
MKTIPDSVLEKICGHRPNLRVMIENLRSAKDQAIIRMLEKRLADAYLMGETELTPLETFYLAACCHGRPYGE